MMDIHKILKQLPHRYPFLLVDRVLEIEKGVRIKALKNVTINEPFFMGHFEQYPVMPGVLIIEALAQAAGIRSIRSEGERPIHPRLDPDGEGVRISPPFEDVERLRAHVIGAAEMCQEVQLLEAATLSAR